MTSGPTRRELAPGGSLDDVDDATLRWAVELAQFVRHPLFVGSVFAAGLSFVGVGILIVSGFGVHDEYYVSRQLPYLISGGFAGLGLVIAGAVLASILGQRRDQAAADRELARVVDEIASLTRAVTARLTAEGPR
ncbi:MAG: hypothetical protein F2667_14445 [Actinobacteria bacterium]|uniref:Unannotated protein n=1 Tax=freshwater metagenome TaxID=449393 RepID=A0A6J6SGW8_9ZZZZ|nr:hypothetical protein [Actinomycetota bacterium]